MSALNASGQVDVPPSYEEATKESWWSHKAVMSISDAINMEDFNIENWLGDFQTSHLHVFHLLA